MELVFLGKANTHGLNSVKLPAYLLCLPQASIGRIDSRGGQNYLSTTSLLSLKLSPAPSRAAFFEPNAWPFSIFVEEDRAGRFEGGADDGGRTTVPESGAAGFAPMTPALNACPPP
jgi:hypothetical protein